LLAHRFFFVGMITTRTHGQNQKKGNDMKLDTLRLFVSMGIKQGARLISIDRFNVAHTS